MKAYENCLIDLSLAGVFWEITDKPNVVQAMQTPETVERTKTTVVVPPIAPVNPISVDTATAMSIRPTDIDTLVRMIGEFNHPLRSSATNVVLPQIAKQETNILIITDMPSSDDDATGKILSGGAGELFNKMLNAIEINRENVSIVPLLFWRTPGGRSASRQELDLARPFVNRLIDLMAPKFILTLGDLAAYEIAGINLGRNHGTPVDMVGDIKVIPIYHPNYIMLKPEMKRDVWNALQNMQNLLKML